MNKKYLYTVPCTINAFISVKREYFKVEIYKLQQGHFYELLMTS